jgi:hypothetical protein
MARIYYVRSGKPSGVIRAFFDMVLARIVNTRYLKVYVGLQIRAI